MDLNSIIMAASTVTHSDFITHVATPTITVSTAVQSSIPVTVVKYSFPSSTADESTSHPAFVQHQFSLLLRLRAAGVPHLPTPSRIIDDTSIEFAYHSRTTLAAWICNTPFTAVTAATTYAIAAQILHTLIALHRINAVYNSLSSETTFINEDNDIVIFDFSHFVLDNLPSQHSRLHPLLSKRQLLSLSPEQTGRVNRPIDIRTDLYGFGIVLYELCTQRIPFFDLIDRDKPPDILECVHAILAKLPDSPIDYCAHVSPELCAIIMRLLHKNGNLRYQSAAALLLEIDQLTTDKALGNIYVNAKFKRPSRLYEREQQSATIFAQIDGMLQDRRNRIIYVTGEAGSGKSVLVQSIRVKLSKDPSSTPSRRTLMFGSAKFDQFLSEELTCFSPIVAELMRAILILPTPSVRHWRKRLLSAVGDNGSLLNQLFPLLEVVIGVQPLASVFPPTEAQQRIAVILPRFLASLTSDEHPLLLFFDDIQWADSASVGQMTAFIQHPDTHSVCIILAYRQENVTINYQLVTTFNETQTNRKTFPLSSTVVEVGPLSIGSIITICGEMLNSPELAVETLAELLHSKSKGNIFFALQLLEEYYENELITLDASSQWRWNMEKLVECTFIGDEIIDIIQLKLRRLSTSAQSLITCAACIGNRFSLASISIAASLAENECAYIIDDLIADDILIVVERHERTNSHEGSHGNVFSVSGKLDSMGNYASASRQTIEDALVYDDRMFAFCHDRIKQAAFGLRDKAQRPLSYFNIGKLLFDYGLHYVNYSAHKDDRASSYGSNDDDGSDSGNSTGFIFNSWFHENGFMLLHLFSHCLDVVMLDDSLRVSVIRLTLAVGIRARATAACQSVQQFIRDAMVLMGFLPTATSDELIDFDSFHSWTYHTH